MLLLVPCLTDGIQLVFVAPACAASTYADGRRCRAPLKVAAHLLAHSLRVMAPANALMVWTSVCLELMTLTLPPWDCLSDYVALTEQRPAAWRRRREVGRWLRVHRSVRQMVADRYRTEGGPALHFGTIPALKAPPTGPPGDTGRWCLRVLLHRMRSPPSWSTDGPFTWQEAVRLQERLENQREENFHLLLQRPDGTYVGFPSSRAVATLTLVVVEGVEGGAQMSAWMVKWFPSPPPSGRERPSDGALGA